MAEHPEDAQIVQLFEFFGNLELPDGITELDLGCGSGSYTVELATRYPDRKIFAADVMIGRLRKLVHRAEKAGCGNLTVWRVEARQLIGRILPDKSFDRIHLLCPDPWPKERHRGNRLLCSDFTTQLHRVLKDDGVFHFSSDDVNYCGAVGRILAASQLFAPAEAGIADLTDISSDFERRWRAQGLTVAHRAWRKLPAPVITIGH